MNTNDSVSYRKIQKNLILKRLSHHKLPITPNMSYLPSSKNSCNKFNSYSNNRSQSTNISGLVQKSFRNRQQFLSDVSQISGSGMLPVISNNNSKIKSLNSSAVQNMNNSDNFNCNFIGCSSSQKRCNDCESINSNLTDLSFLEKQRILNQASKIVKERAINRAGLANSRSVSVFRAIQNAKEISLKNYLIELIKKQRKINGVKENVLAQALKNGRWKLMLDYKKFINFCESQKELHQKEEDYLAGLISQKSLLLSELSSLSSSNKLLFSEVSKLIHSLTTLKNFGSFLHQIFRSCFLFGNIEDFRLKGQNLDDATTEKIEEISENYVRIFNEKNCEIPLPAELKMPEILERKYVEMEEKLRKILTEKEAAERDLEKVRKVYEEMREGLNSRMESYQVEYSSICEELKAFKKEQFYNFNDRKELIEENVQLLMEIYSELGGKKYAVENKRDGENEKIDVLICNLTLDKLRNLEDKVTSLINEINQAENSSNPLEKSLIFSFISQRKDQLKIEKQLENKKLKEKLIEKKRLLLIERGNKVIFKGRKVPEKYKYIIKGRGLEEIKKEIESDSMALSKIINFDSTNL